MVTGARAAPVARQGGEGLADVVCVCVCVCVFVLYALFVVHF